MPLERERLIFFAYFNSPLYKSFILEASRQPEFLYLDAELVLKVWEDGFLQFAASHPRGDGTTERTICPLPTIVDANTNQVQHLSDLDKLDSSGLVTLFSQIVNSGMVWQMKKTERDCDLCNREYACDNPMIALLTKRVMSGHWDGIDDFAVLRRLIDAGEDNFTIANVACIAHELWGTQLWDERVAVCVDTVLKWGMSEETSVRVSRVMEAVGACRPERELMAAFAEPAPFGLCRPEKTLMHFSTPLLRVLPIGPVFSGSDEHRRLEKFAPLIRRLSLTKAPIPRHSLRLERVEWSMEVYRLSVEVSRCQSKNSSAIDPLSCNRPFLRVPMLWRRAYNRMGIECTGDLVI